MRIINWVKQNKLATILILIILYLLFKKDYFATILPTTTRYPYESTQKFIGMESGAPLSVSESYIPPPTKNLPPTESKDRLVIQESNLSLLVKDVKSTSDKIVDFAKTIGGFMVNTSFSNPEEAPIAHVTIRVPSDKLKETLEYLRNLAVKVVSENLTGEDVTDQYTDINARLETLNKTKAKFEEILAKATQIPDILNVQRELINLQDQIDSLKGQKEYLEKSAKLSKITIYLATDELVLPYAPSETWRPEVIFKTAVRSLIKSLRSVGSLLIWAVVYSVIWLPIILAFLIYKKIKPRKLPPSN